MNERSFGKAAIAAMSLCLLATLLVPAIRDGGSVWLFSISLCVGILAVFAYLQFRKRRRRVTPMSVIGFLWFVLCLPLLLFVSAVFSDYWARHSGVFGAALNVAAKSEIARAELGSSPKIGWPIETETAFAHNSETILLRIPVNGSRGKETLRAHGTKAGGVWQLDALELRLPNGDALQIVKAAGPESIANPSPVESNGKTGDAAGKLDQNSQSSGFGLLSPWYMIMICCALGPVFFIIAIPYTLTLQRALMKCAPECRAMLPSLLWMLFIPFVGLITNFFVVSDMADSLRAEFRRRGVPYVDDKTKKIGMTMCICWVCSFFHLVGIPAIVASPVLWFIYWRRIAKLSRLLDSVPVTPA